MDLWVGEIKINPVLARLVGPIIIGSRAIGNLHATGGRPAALYVLLPTLRFRSYKQVARGAKPKYSGMIDCAKQLHATGGLRSVFKGWEVTLMRDVPG